MSDPTIHLGTRDDTWRDFAACKHLPKNVFYPETPNLGRVTSQDALKQLEDRAKAICATCPVTQACLDDALTLPPTIDQGIRGCTNEVDRREIRRQRGETLALSMREKRTKNRERKRERRGAA